MEKYCTAGKVKQDNEHSDYVILTAFPLQQWEHERASLLRYTYIACFVSKFLYYRHLMKAPLRPTCSVFQNISVIQKAATDGL